MSLDTLKPVCILKNESISSITVIEWEKNIDQINNKNHLIIMTGCSLGIIRAYAVNLGILKGCELVNISPVLSIQAHSSAVSHIKFDAFKIVSASLDRDIKIFDSISGLLVQSLLVKNSRRASTMVKKNSK